MKEQTKKKEKGGAEERDKSKDKESNKEYKSQDEEVVVVDSSDDFSEDSDSLDEFSSAGTVDEIEDNKEKDVKIKNLISIVIVLAGIAVGSLFVDVMQFVSGGGYSERALRDAEVFVAGDKTWVAYDDPVVEIDVLSVSDEELEECGEDCNPEKVVNWLKKFVPTAIANKVEYRSEKGDRLMKDLGIKAVPAYVFSSSIKDTEFYKGEASILFTENDDKFLLNGSAIGVPAGKYIDTPKVSEQDYVLGDKDAKVKMIVFSDFQCPYCSKFYATAKKIAEEFEDVALVYRDMPLDFHAQAEGAAIASRCAGYQGKFWEMATELYEKQGDWGKTGDSEMFKGYASKLSLDRKEFDSCLEDKAQADLVEEDAKAAKEFGVTGTPATFLNDKFVSGLVDEKKLREMIQTELGGGKSSEEDNSGEEE